MKPVRLLVHCSLLEALGPALEGDDHAKPLRKALEKISADPRGAGRILQGLKLPSRIGQVRRVWVKGRGGYRLIYYVPDSQDALEFQPVIPLFVSEVTRGNFDWDDIDPNTVGQDVEEDFCARNYDRFRVYGL